MESLMEHEQRTLLLLGYNAIKSHVVVHNIILKYLKSESSQLYSNYDLLSAGKGNKSQI